jgi:thiosulfate dehydrogenase
LPKPPLPADYARGAQVYAEKCAACHGPQGLGQSSGGKVVFPPLWGAQSYNWGAGMGSVKNAAEFIRANMPLGLGNTLTEQQAWDVATYIDSQVRPQDPRFVGNVEETRKKFHDTPFSMYGRTVNGAVLGDPAITPPAATVPAATIAPATQ